MAMLATIYKNLHRGDWSIAAIRGKESVGRVIGHEREIGLANVRFIVRETARQRIVLSMREVFHA
jgi:hypothetical protein